MSETTKEVFDDAVSWLSGTPAAASLPTDQKLELYGIFKFINTGSGPNGSRPGMFAFEAKAKYDAWAKTASEYAGREGDARARYVEIARSVGYTGAEEGEEAEGGKKKSGGTGMGVGVSVMAPPEAYEGPHSMVHDAAAAGAVNDLKAVLLLDPSLLNAKDEFGFTPLHLAADRGHAPAVAYLLSLGADKSILDPDEQTALEIATISGRDDVVELLK